MTDPSDEGDPALEVAGSGPAASPVPTIGDRDGGVARRLTTRCRIAAAVLAAIAGSCLLIVTLRTWTAGSAVLALIAGSAITGAVLLWRRASLWSAVAKSPSGGPGTQATVGPPQRLSPGIPGAPLKRRLGARVLPIHAAVDPQPGGGALVVHARADGIELGAGDDVRVRSVGVALEGALGGALDAAGGGSGTAPIQTSGRFVIDRVADGAVFLATTRLADTW